MKITIFLLFSVLSYAASGQHAHAGHQPQAEQNIVDF